MSLSVNEVRKAKNSKAFALKSGAVAPVNVTMRTNKTLFTSLVDVCYGRCLVAMLDWQDSCHSMINTYFPKNESHHAKERLFRAPLRKRFSNDRNRLK